MNDYHSQHGTAWIDLPDGRVALVQEMLFGKARVYLFESRENLTGSGGW